LGLNVMRRDLDARFGAGTSERVARRLRDSVRHAIDHGDQTRAFLLARSDERPEWKEPGLLERYLSMYVNEQTVDMGEAGVRSLRTLFTRGAAAGLCVDPGEIDAI
jgi:1,4-dihydroxy-6-naphthoate synthase